jgi:hypothetical protein
MLCNLELLTELPDVTSITESKPLLQPLLQILEPNDDKAGQLPSQPAQNKNPHEN